MPHRIFKPVKFSLILIALSWVLSNIGTSNLYVWGEAFGWNYAPGQNVITASLAIGLYGFVLLYMKYILIGVMRIADDSHSGAVYVYNLLRKVRKKIPSHLMKMIGVAVAVGSIALIVDGFLTAPVSTASALESARDVTGSHISWVKEFLSNEKVVGIPKITFVGMCILSLLFFLHRFGPSRFNFLFGPLVVLYFASSLVTGIMLTFKTGGMGILFDAMNPLHLFSHIKTIWVHDHRAEILGGLFLFFSGFEAAFADSGLTGKRSMFVGVNIFFLCVLFQYVGQANMLKFGLLESGAGSPFAQGLLQLPSSIAISHSTLAIAATIMASFSLMVAVQHVFYELAEIEWFARLKKKYFGEGEFVAYSLNFAQWAGCMIIYGVFQYSENMLAMYGITICAVLISTSIIIGMHQVVFAKGWKRSLSLVIVFLCIMGEVVFFEASLHKLDEGGYVSILLMFMILPLIVTWRYFEKYKKEHQFRVARHSKMAGIINQELVPLLVPTSTPRSINAVYCKKLGNLTSTDFCAMRGMLLKREVKVLYMFSVKHGKSYDFKVAPISDRVFEVIRTYPSKSPQYNDDILNEIIGTYKYPQVPIGEHGQSDWEPFRANRNLETINGGQTTLWFGIGKIIYRYLKTKEEKVDFNQTIGVIDIPVNTEKHTAGVVVLR